MPLQYRSKRIKTGGFLLNFYYNRNGKVKFCFFGKTFLLDEKAFGSRFKPLPRVKN